ncbi:MAG: FmdB family zinc ribbon protein [Planctomycetota bacterium]|jgi:putative FmdB family regulatory protein
MPTYDYACPDCGSKFEVRARMSEKAKGLEPVCPDCGGKDAVQVFGAVSIITGGKGGGPSPCGPGAGPGCCPSR